MRPQHLLIHLIKLLISQIIVMNMGGLDTLRTCTLLSRKNQLMTDMPWLTSIGSVIDVYNMIFVSAALKQHVQHMKKKTFNHHAPNSW